MREALAHAVNSSNLGMEESYEHDADKIAAMAFGPRLGSLLVRYRDGGQARWKGQATCMIAYKLIRKLRLNRELSLKIATHALHEWADPHCLTCGGAREVMGERIKVICHVCNGTGIRRYTDIERKNAIGGCGGKIEDGLRLAHATITGAVAGTVGVALVQLERV